VENRIEFILRGDFLNVDFKLLLKMEFFRKINFFLFHFRTLVILLIILRVREYKKFV